MLRTLEKLSDEQKAIGNMSGMVQRNLHDANELSEACENMASLEGQHENFTTRADTLKFKLEVLLQAVPPMCSILDMPDLVDKISNTIDVLIDERDHIIHDINSEFGKNYQT